MSDSVMSPVLIVTYDRLEHLKATISSLRENIYAELTDLFIASDFQRSNSEAKKIVAVRNYLHSVDGFKSVTVFAQNINLGVVDNSNSAVQFIFERFNQIIIMNDDLITAPGFLKFMNKAFKEYDGNERIFSISGYCPPIQIPSSYKFDAFFLGRMSAWGCGITKDRYNRICDITRQDFDKLTADKKLRNAFVKSVGKDILPMLKRVAYGSFEAWDVQCIYTQFTKNQYTIYPAKSLVQNIGFDGTGMHCGKSDRFNVSLSKKKSFHFPDTPFLNNQIVRANFIFYGGGTYALLLAKANGTYKKQAKKIKKTLSVMLPDKIKKKYGTHWHKITRTVLHTVTLIKIISKKTKNIILPLHKQIGANENLYLHLGCGKVDKKEFINIDGFPYKHVDFVQSIDKLSQFKDNSVDLIYACHCLEHFCYQHTESVLQEWFRVLKKNGILRLCVPDFDKLVNIYQAHNNNPDIILGQLMGGQDKKYNYHLTTFNIVNLTKHLENVGFSHINNWEPGSDNLTTFNDFSTFRKEINGQEYDINLNLEATK